MSVATQLKSNNTKISETTESALSRALAGLRDSGQDLPEIGNRFCDFARHLTNACCCAIFSINVENETVVKNGGVSQNQYAGSTVHDWVVKTFRSTNLNTTIFDQESGRTLRIVGVGQEPEKDSFLLIALECLSESPLASALVQERLEIATALLAEIVDNRRPLDELDAQVVESFIGVRSRRAAARNVRQQLLSILKTETIFIVPVINGKVKPSDVASVDETSDNLRNKLCVVATEITEGAVGQTTHFPLKPTTLAVRSFTESIGDGLHTAISLDENSSGVLIFHNGEKNALSGSQLRAIANGFTRTDQATFFSRSKNKITNASILKAFPENIRVQIACLLPLLILAAPVPQTVRGNATIVPDEQQVITAPFTGRLKSVSVEPGARVSANETVLATLDTNDLLAERDKLQAEYSKHLTEWKIERAAGNAAEARLAQLRAKELSARLSFNNYRINQANIMAPVSGLLQGDNQKQNTGINVRQGQELFRIVGETSKRVEFDIPIRRTARFVENRKLAAIMLNAFPGKKLQIRDIEFYPIAEFENGKTSIRGVGTVAIPKNLVSGVRPGMRGTIEKSLGFQPAIFALGREPIRRVRIFLGI